MDFMRITVGLCCTLAVIHLTQGSGSHGSSSETPNQFTSSGMMLYIEEPWSATDIGGDPSGGVSDKCMKLLEVFTNTTGDYLQCIMTNARPLHYCENCIEDFTYAMNAFNAICADEENGTTCRDQLLRADNVQVVLLAYDFVKSIWDKSSCHNCYNATVKNGTTVYKPTVETLEMLTKIKDVQSCFQDFGQSPADNMSVCHLCAELYTKANIYYIDLDKDAKLCSDLKDSMNYTRRMWSKDFKCDIGVRTDLMIYGMAVAIGFLPVFFYVGAYASTKWRFRRRPQSREGTVEERDPINLLGTSAET